MISCGQNQSSNPTGCIVESFNLAYYLERSPEAFIRYFDWVPYDLYTHKDKNCSFDVDFKNFTDMLSERLQLQPQFNLYNIPMIYYVK